MYHTCVCPPTLNKCKIIFRKIGQRLEPHQWLWEHLQIKMHGQNGLLSESLCCTTASMTRFPPPLSFSFFSPSYILSVGEAARGEGGHAGMENEWDRDAWWINTKNKYKVLKNWPKVNRMLLQSFKKRVGRAWWHILFAALGRQKQVGICGVQDSLVYI